MKLKALRRDKNIYRIDDMVRRPMETWSKNIHLFREHLLKNNFPVPRIVKVDENYEYEEYLNGKILNQNEWDDELIFSVGKLVKKLHIISKTFCHNDNMLWKTWYLRELGEPILCGHGDLTPWNVIISEKKIIGIIDWEFTGPIDPLIELARVCWFFSQLFDDDTLPPIKKRLEKMRLIIDTYELSRDERKIFFERIIEVIICETAHEAIDGKYSRDSVGNLWGMAWKTKSLYYIIKNKETIKKAII